jgi:hypothetical protein
MQHHRAVLAPLSTILNATIAVRRRQPHHIITLQVETNAQPSQSHSYTLGGGSYYVMASWPHGKPADSPASVLTQSVVGKALGSVEYEDSPPMYEDNIDVGVGTNNTTRSPMVSGKRWKGREVPDRTAIHFSFVY